jgi:hypothetical protein
MRWTKLNTTFDADPNAPEPRVAVSGDTVQVRFFLNSFIWDDVADDDEAELTFIDVIKYRIGSTNDEGFYRGQCRFSTTGIEWGNFYHLDESNWQNSFPTDAVIISDPQSMSAPKHYLFYFRDETFECIARRYEFQRLARGK